MARRHTDAVEDDTLPVSKTQLKKQMDALQALGKELTALSSETLKKAGLPPDLLEAVLAYKKINSNSALKRQVQYIGRLMREVDPAPIEAFLSRIKGENTAYNARMHRLERWRDRLIAEDEALTELAEQYVFSDTGAVRTLIRNARKEAELQKPPKSYRALFQLLRKELGHQEI